MTRHAEIAGAGFAGLVAAISLAKSGWSVRVHERSELLRMEGFAIGVHENALRVLDTLGVLEPILDGGRRISELRRVDQRGRILFAMTPDAKVYRLPRAKIIKALAREAEDAGVEILFKSEIESAEQGVLIGIDGKRWQCDIVIGADGVNSRVRQTSGISVHRKDHRDGAMRFMLPPDPDGNSDSDSETSGNVSYEYWSGRRRIVRHRASAEEVYFALTADNRDIAATRVPVDVDSWQNAFPELEGLFARMRETVDWSVVQWVAFKTMRPSAWSKGSIALIGDSATAMPPNLGQGAGVAMMNALSLAVNVHETGDIHKQLRDWEASERPLSDHTQRWAGFYSSMGLVPDIPRRFILGGMSNISWFKKQYQRTAQHIPTGTV